MHIDKGTFEVRIPMFQKESQHEVSMIYPGTTYFRPPPKFDHLISFVSQKSYLSECCSCDCIIFTGGIGKLNSDLFSVLVVECVP